MRAYRRSSVSGLRDSVLEFAGSGRPLLGICVGMQMLTLGSEEGNLAGLGLIQAHTRQRFPPAADLRIPYMGLEHRELAGSGASPGAESFG